MLLLILFSKNMCETGIVEGWKKASLIFCGIGVSSKENSESDEDCEEKFEKLARGNTT